MGAYVTANGVHTYYEVTGAGDPVVLLHGGMSTVDSWLPQISALSRQYRVYAPERRGHGRTPDVPGPVSYELMADDTAAFLHEVGIGPAHLVGWSDGAVVAALVALHHPHLVGKLVLVGQYFNPDGRRPEWHALVDSADGRLEAMFRTQYEHVSPDGPQHFAVVYAKMLHLWRTEPDIPLPTLARIKAPTLVMQADDDLVTVEHSAALAAALPDAQLAVLPGTSHAAPLEKAHLVNQLLLDFLAAEQRRKLMPLAGP